MSKNSQKIPNPILIKKKQVKQGDLWNETAKLRFFKQHGDIEELPENDAHAVRKYQDPTYAPPTSPEETKAAMDSLTDKIKQLKDQGNAQTQPKKISGGSFYDEWID